VTRILVVLGCLVGLPRAVAAQSDTTVPGAQFGFGVPAFSLEEPAVLRAPWMGAPRSTPALRGAAFDSSLAVTLAADRMERAAGLRMLALYGTPLRPLAELGQGEEGLARRRNPLGLPSKYADLTLDGQARLEVRTDRVREERCSPALSVDPNSGCRGSFRAPSLDNQVNIRSTGILGRRIHVNVDFDTEREYSSNNDIQIYYEGLEDEIVRRVDVGTVTFQPPPSRFITAAVPANNFGVNAVFDLGPIQLQTLAATQKGSVVAERTYTIGQTTSQAQDRQARDLDFESGRFFWVVDPDSVPGTPAVDILEVDPEVLPATYRPTEVRLYRYRAARGNSGVNPNLGGITATANRGGTLDPLPAVRWELLIQGTDYYLDDSGLWVVLATKLDQNDYLATSFRTAAGTTVGTFPEVDQGPGSTDVLELIAEPQQTQERRSFRHEMRNVYRVAGADLDPASLQVGVTLNRSERPVSGSAETYLQQLGLSLPNDPTLFDRENRLWPRARDPEAAVVVGDRYIVFPHLEPFADPTRLSPPEITDSLYRTPVYLLLTEGPTAKFTLRLRYDASGGSDRSTLSLNALQIREGSEQLFVGGRKLERDVDYRISYDVGQVTFIDPDLLFGQSSAQITARFEERGIFAVAPTTILGMSTRYSLGERGAINLIGMYQREQSAFTRPALGFEATANLIGGVNTELHFRPQGITSFLNKLTSSATSAPSLLDVNAEFAFSKPDPNRSGEAYLEEFESESGLLVPMREAQWEFGSMPESARGLEDIGIVAFDSADAVQLIWQNLVPVEGTNQPVELRPQDIDTLIRLAGRGEEPEPVLYTTLHADTAGGIVQRNNSSRWSQPRRDLAPRWRSMVTGLSTTGLDLTRNEFLEFWVFQPAGEPADSAGLRLVIDLGTVSEDAVALAPDTLTVSGADSLFTGRQFVGAGELDTERSDIGIFNADVDDVGILGDVPPIFEIPDGPIGELPICSRTLGSVVALFRWGDLSARCTRGNGVLDTEDLDGDQLLNATGAGEDVFRYVVDLARGDFYVRDGVTTRDTQGRTATWRLYRIPLREAADTINTPTMRLVKHMRITYVTPPDAGQPDVIARLALARMRFLGSPWTRRSDTPILGLSGSAGEPGGEVSVSVVSTENRTDLGYESPPGIGDEVARRGGDRESGGTQINERSLRILAEDLQVDQRAEAYLRFPAGPQNLLNYRTLRVWFRGRGPGWEEGDLQSFLKLGSDDRNFYLYRSPSRSTTWEPETVIDLETWRQLRAVVENRWLSGEPASGAAECGTRDPNAYVACDGPYLVHLGDPGINPPNLAAVQEVSAGMYRVGSTVTTTTMELWVDDIRLSDPVSQIGTAASIDARLTASDVANVSVAYTRQSGQFRQINQDPSYRASGALQVTGNLRLERFLPTSFGLAMPLTVSYSRLGVNPELLTGTDLRGEALPGLRKPTSWSTSYALAVRRSKPANDWLTKALLDPLVVTASYTRGRAQTELSEARSRTFGLNLNYNLVMKRRGFRLPLGGLAGILPGFIREGEAGKALQRATVSLVPSRVRFTSALNRDEANSTAFRFPTARSDDRLLRPTLALTHLWRNAAGVTWQPLGMLNLSGDLTSTRDLRVYPDSNPIGRLAYNERRFLLGVPVGVERDRLLSTTLSLTPGLASWLRPRLLSSSSFILSRTLTSRDPVRAEGESGAFILPKTLNNSRSNELGVAVDLGRAFQLVAGDSSTLAKLLGRVRPLDLSTRLTRSSTFDLTAFEPSVGYQLGLGGLDKFLRQRDAAALGVTESRTANLASGADLPLGFSVTLSHALTRTTRLQRVGGSFLPTETNQREWPVGNARWSRTFRGGPLSLLAFGTSFRRRKGNSIQGSRGDGPGVQSAIESSTITPDAQISFRNGVSLILGYNELDQSSLSNGNQTQLDQNDISGSLNYAFRLPRSLSRLRKQVRTSLSLIATDAKTCLEQSGNESCIVISDVSRYEVRGGLDTDLLQTVSAGLQLGYSLNDARHLSRRTSQISVLASFQLSLFAGDYR
jgi:hypothetical protein